MTVTIESEKTIRVEERIAELERKMVRLLAEKTVWQAEAKELISQLGQVLTQIAQLVLRVHE